MKKRRKVTFLTSSEIREYSLFVLSECKNKTFMNILNSIPYLINYRNNHRLHTLVVDVAHLTFLFSRLIVAEY